MREGDLDERRGSLLVRRGKGGRRREVGMDTWGWEQLGPWLDMRRELPVGPLLCVINGTTRGRHRSSAAARAELRRTAAAAGVWRRFAPHQLRHAHAVEMAREGVPLIVIQRQLGHSDLGISPYLHCDSDRLRRRCGSRKGALHRRNPTPSGGSFITLWSASGVQGPSARRRAKHKRRVLMPSADAEQPGHQCVVRAVGKQGPEGDLGSRVGTNDIPGARSRCRHGLLDDAGDLSTRAARLALDAISFREPLSSLA